MYIQNHQYYFNFGVVSNDVQETAQDILRELEGFSDFKVFAEFGLEDLDA